MDTITYSITLADGSMLTNLTLNGTNYVSKNPVDSSIFENNCSVVKIEDSEGDSKTYYNMELVQIMLTHGEYFIILREISESEIQAKRIAASLNYICSNVSDEDAAKFADIFPVWDSAKAYAVGDRVKFGDKLFKCITEHTAQVTWNPTDAPSLWARTDNPAEEWPEWVQPTGATDVYAKGAKVTHNGKHWVSDVENNSWEPGAYGWTEQI